MADRLIDKISQAPRRREEPEESSVDRLRATLHRELLERVDLVAAAAMPPEVLRERLRELLAAKIAERALPLAQGERQRVVEEILDEILGLGPLERIVSDPAVSDILVNGPHCVFVERGGKLERTEVRFRDEEHLRTVIDRIVGAVGRRVDEASPLVDARLADGSRVNAVIPPVALDGSLLSIRRFGAAPITADRLVALGAVPRQAMDLLRAAVAGRLNMVVSGGTGSGKTTLLNALSSFIPAGERIVTIEDAAELRLQQGHVARMETRPPNLEGLGEVTTRSLVKNALRMRPDRIIVGEIRGAEAIDMLQAMNTGHAGSLCTLHANSPRHALRRVETMVSLGMPNVPTSAIREIIADALDVIIQISRLSDGSRRLLSITEVTGMEGSVISTQELVRFRQAEVTPQGKVRGAFEASGIRPAFADRLAAKGHPLGSELTRWSLEV